MATSMNIKKTQRSSGLNIGKNQRWDESLFAGIRNCNRQRLGLAWPWKVTLLPLLVWILLYCVFFRSSFDPFDRPFCDIDGTCHEQTDVPSPRTIYSAWNKEQYDLWWKHCQTLKHRVEAYANKRQQMYDNNPNDYDSPVTRPLILLGDSITESWSETGMGIHKNRAEGVASVMETELSSSSGLDPIVLGVSGDQTQHLLYRLQNGHMRAAQLSSSLSSSSSSNESGAGGDLFYDPSAIFVVMIGTNNLGSGELPGPTTKGILAVVEYILKETAESDCHVMLFRVLPRGDGKKVLPKLCPPRCSDDAGKKPYSSFLPPIQNVNEALAKGVERLGKAYSYPSDVDVDADADSDSGSSSAPRIRLVDCGSEFLNENHDDQKGHGVVADGNNYEVRKELMPDLLHPNAMGHQILAKCIRDYIVEIDG